MLFFLIPLAFCANNKYGYPGKAIELTQPIPFAHFHRLAEQQKEQGETVASPDVIDLTSEPTEVQYAQAPSAMKKRNPKPKYWKRLIFDSSNEYLAKQEKRRVFEGEDAKIREDMQKYMKTFFLNTLSNAANDEVSETEIEEEENY